MNGLSMNAIPARLRQLLQGVGAKHVGIAFGLLAAAALVMHLTVIFWLPRHANWQVWQFLSGEGQLVNAWFHSPRQTPDNAGDVKAAPEIGYSTCAIDLAQGPVRLRVNAWTPYTSLALYDATGFNFFVLNDTQMDQGFAEIVLGAEGGPDGAFYRIQSPTRRAVAIVRRLIPTEEGWAEVAAVRAGDVCGVIPPEEARS
jgi:uncharacterized membrane protein